MADHARPAADGASPEGRSVTNGIEPWGETSVVGKPLPRVDAYLKVSGSAVYSLDRTLPGMLHGAILRCPHAHAMVRAIDAREAAAMPGVHAVLTADDPEGGMILPKPFWITAGPEIRLFDPHCRFAGEEVAAVAADTPHRAWDAIRAIRVEYEELPFVVEIEDAARPDAPAVHDGGNRLGPPDVYERGDVAKGLAEAEVIVERSFRTSFEIHTPMEVHCSVASWDGGRLTVWDSTQGVFDQQKAIAQALGLPMSSVRVIGPYMGGGFGGKAELGKYTVIASLLARRTGRPVKVALTREETFTSAGCRPGTIIAMKAGARSDGTLTALSLVSAGGVGASADDSAVGGLARNLYLCPNVRTEESSYYLNTGKIRAMRAPGYPQGAWALEQLIDEIAELTGIDPVEYRLQNIATFLQRANLPYTTIGLQECLRQGAEAFGWKQARSMCEASRGGRLVRGVGVAACLWGNPGGPPATVVLRLYSDGSLNLNLGTCDIGTGTQTVMAMAASEELGIPLERIQVESADTATTQYSQVAGGSQTVINNTPAVRAAAAEIRRQLLEIASEELGVPAAELSLRGGKVVAASSPAGAKAYSELAGLDQRQVLIGIGHRHPNPPDKLSIPFAAQFAEVEVDRQTGELRVVRLVAAHDSGRVMNWLTYENQVFGGMAMGIGFGLLERRVMDPQTGRMVNANWHDYKIPTIKDVPADQICIPVDLHDTGNTTGTKGLGEPATIPTAAAIANAVCHATGIRVLDAPITPMRMLELLRDQARRG